MQSGKQMWKIGPALVAGLAVAVMTVAPADAAERNVGRDFDARQEVRRSTPKGPAPQALARVEGLRSNHPHLQARFDAETGVLRSLSDPGNAFTDAAPGVGAEVLAQGWLLANNELLGLSAADLAEFTVADSVYSEVGDTTHLYLNQSHQGLPVYNGLLQINLDGDGRVLSVANDFVPDLALAVNTRTPRQSAAQAVHRAALHLGLNLNPSQIRQDGVRVEAPGLSDGPIETRLALLPVRDGEVRLVWNFVVAQLETFGEDGEPHRYDFTVDAVNGQVWTRFDQVDADDYTVYPQPVESPIHTAPLPPADARVTLTNPAHPFVSPFAWHDTDGVSGPEFTTLRGNNVRVISPGTAPDCGPSILCNFAINLAGAPATYIGATSSNLFYWNNTVHDIQALYGFDSPSGNFQENTYGAGGLGGDAVQARDQDPGCLNNAFFSTPPDGSQPTMFMCNFTLTTPNRASSLENSITVHEYGHGISNRLVGGPANVGCLSNTQQPGEGLSDWWALAYTAEVGDTGPDARGIGTYVLGEPATGPGIRTQPYSTDPAVNTHSYASIGGGLSVPHGVGEVWATAAWEAYWALVDKWGFDPNLANPFGGAGNQRMMLYVNEGLKFTPCSPTFLDVRDGILQAAAANYGGVDVCRLWTAFAAFGLGSDATTVGPNSLVATDGFAVPANCETDVFTKDDAADVGTEPNPFPGPYWQSPDIWVRNDMTPGPHQNPEFGQTNYIHVKVRQRTTSGVEAHNVPVRVYYANASTGLAWPTDWTLIDTGIVTSLPPGNDTEIVVPWDPPGTGHYCLLSRIDTGQDPMTFVEVASVNTNTKNNNNIAWKNTNVVDLIPGFSDGPLQVDVEFIFRNHFEFDGEFFLVFQEPEEQLRAPFLARGEVTVTFPEELVALMQEAGTKAEGMEALDDATYVIRDPQRASIFVPVKARQEFKIRMNFRDTIGANNKEPIQYLFDVVQEDANQQPVGGVNYVINALVP